MVDFVMNMLAEIADFFIDLWLDKVINRLTAKKQERSN